ncbi:alanine racemase [Devosia rhodophyticola]|uniref:Alanine racemase n=1 Tax=Devosia rhodophyticola TaxID=3026423 RepID=A0ABY7YTR8_9HYPH|nr:alanine racemase [Devosia rhodophyticola]WDR04745.1 alanine racemase [Devosia rhodophyticola]
MVEELPAVSGGRDWVALPVATPGLVLDRDVFDANMDEMVAIARSAGVELVPHAKTHRMAAVGQRQIERGAVGLCVAKIGEAEAFADAGIARLFVANPVIGADKLARALDLAGRVDLTLAIDGVDAAKAIGACFASADKTIKLMLAIDSGLGREGVNPDKAADVAASAADLPGVDLVGIYTHEGSTYGAVDRADLEARAVAAGTLMANTAEAIRARGLPLPVVSMGASASARAVAHVPGVTQIRPGIFAFNDVGQIALGNAGLDTTAIRVIATVTSHPDPNRACIDAGSKSLSTDLVPAGAHRAEYPGHGMLVNAPGWIIEKMSEEHGWLRWHGQGKPSLLPVGTRLEIVPNHVCMAFALLRKATVLSHQKVVDTWEGFGAGASE